MNETDVLRRALKHAIAYLDQLDQAPVAPAATAEELRHRLGSSLPEEGADPERVLDDLVKHVESGLLRSSSGRFFGWVIGGTTPASIAADWLASVWDQNAAKYSVSPGAAVTEEITGAWLKQLLGLPEQASFGIVTGTQMAHVTALSAARNHLLQARGWDVEARGLMGAPKLHLLASAHRHETIVRAARLLGLGRGAIGPIACDHDGRMRLDALDAALADAGDEAVILCLQAGDLNTGAFDPFAEACARAHSSGAWVHVDGAFGLWANVSPKRRHQLAGIEQADSWVTDGHKWLNVPYDAGYVFTAHPEAHQAAFSERADYVIAVEGARDASDWGPEWSRRARAFPTYAAIRSLGRRGIAEMVENCCQLAERLVDGIGEIPGAEVLMRPRINQGLVRFVADDGDHDARTEAVARAIRDDGTAWLGTTTWHGMRVIRVSVCNWRTSRADVERTLDATRRIATQV